MNAANDDRTRFDRLCELRALYARRGAQDREGVISISEAMQLALASLLDPDRTPAPGTH